MKARCLIWRNCNKRLNGKYKCSQISSCVTSGCHRAVNEICTLLGNSGSVQFYLLTDISAKYIGPIFKGQVVREKRLLYPLRWNRYVVPKRRYETTIICLRYVKSQISQISGVTFFLTINMKFSLCTIVTYLQ